MHTNSIEAYREGNVSGELGKRAALILGKIRELGVVTDREVRDVLGFADMNAVRPRITELIRSGHLEEVESITDPVTGRKVRRVRVKVELPERQLEQPALFEMELATHWGF